MPAPDIPPFFLDQLPEASVRHWPNHAPAACSFTFDDGTMDQYEVAAPILDRFGIAGSFYLITDLMEIREWDDSGTLRYLFTWDEARDLAARGHEIGSHTASHADLGRFPELATEELSRARKALQANVPGADLYTVSWPYWRSTAESRAAAEDFLYFGRAGGVAIPEDATHYAGVNGVEPEDWFRVGAYGVLRRDTPERIAIAMDRILSTGGWLVLNFHGFLPEGVDSSPVAGVGWEPYRAEDFVEVVEMLVERGFWCAPFGTVARYMRQRNETTVTVQEEGGAIFLSATSNLRQDVFNQPLEIDLHLPDAGAAPLLVIIPSFTDRVDLTTRIGELLEH